MEYLAELSRIIDEAVAPSAEAIDRQGTFPRTSVKALGEAGLLGLISSTEVGGLGQAHRAATTVVETLARSCASTAMVVCMHYAATAVIEAHGPRKNREAIAAGSHLTTLAFSEVGSRSHFWAPLSSATADGGGIRLEARKSWVTSAGEADSYVWSSRPVAAAGASTLWLVDRGTPGLSIPAPFDGLGLRGNASNPITAQKVVIDSEYRLGADGSGFDIMMGVVLPYFQLMSAGFSLGTSEASVAKTIEHAKATRFEQLGQTLAEQPMTRGYIARMRVKADMIRSLLLAALEKLETGNESAMLAVLEVKAAAAEAATEITDLAMRVCGGAAFRKEIGVERHFRDARAAMVMAPTTDALYDFIGKAVCGLPLFE
jgi:alkylation response protein AidB-like acyl-CoA dehydrogenase